MNTKPNIKTKICKILAILLCLLLCFEQTGFAQVAAQLDIAGHLAGLHNALTADRFRPLHLRYLQYLPETNSFKLLLDKGDFVGTGLKPVPTANARIEEETKVLLKYFFIGLALPNDAFWVNLRPDSPDNIIDDQLARTDIGRILLEADVQLKKDTAQATSPETPEGRVYWDKLYQKAGELFGNQNVTIPTLTRPWIVPDEIIIRETTDSAYIYKATLKVMLEEDYFERSSSAVIASPAEGGTKQSLRNIYKFDDPRLKELNTYSSQLIRELIIPKLIKEVNTSKKYAALRQVYYSLILASWFKARNQGKDNQYARLINRRDLTNLTSKESWSKDTYFKAYKENFEKGEYNIREPTYTPYGQTIRSYFSGGIAALEPTVAPFGTAQQVDPSGTRIVVGPAAREIPDVQEAKGPLVNAKAQGRNETTEVEITMPPSQSLRNTSNEGTDYSRRSFLKTLGLAGISAIVLGRESVIGQSIAAAKQKVYLLFHKHMTDVTAYYNLLTNPEIAIASYHVKMDRDIKTRDGAREGEKKLLEIRNLTAEEYEQAIKDELNKLSRYRMSVLEIRAKNSSLIKEHRKEVEAIKKAVSEQRVVAVGTEWTPEELEEQKKSAKERRDNIIDCLKAADYKDYLQQGDDLFLILVGPELYLFATGYPSFVKGEVKLIGLEPSEIKQNGKKLADAVAIADEKLLNMRPDIAEQWQVFKLKINNNGRLLSYYEIDEGLNALFGSNKVGRKEAERVVDILLEFYRNSDERDKFVVQQLVGIKENILVVRGEEHKPMIQKAIKEELSKGGKFEAEEVRPALVAGRLQGLFVLKADGSTVIYINRNEIDAYLDDFVQVLGKEHPDRDEVLRYLDGHETFHALINKLRSGGKPLSEIDKAEEERLAEIFGKVFALGHGNVDPDLIDEIEAIESAFGVTLLDTLRQRPQNIEAFLDALGISVEIKAAIPQEMEEIKTQVREKAAAAAQARPGEAPGNKPDEAIAHKNDTEVAVLSDIKYLAGATRDGILTGDNYKKILTAKLAGYLRSRGLGNFLGIIEDAYNGYNDIPLMQDIILDLMIDVCKYERGSYPGFTAKELESHLQFFVNISLGQTKRVLGHILDVTAISGKVIMYQNLGLGGVTPPMDENMQKLLREKGYSVYELDLEKLEFNGKPLKSMTADEIRGCGEKIKTDERYKTARIILVRFRVTSVSPLNPISNPENFKLLGILSEADIRIPIVMIDSSSDEYSGAQRRVADYYGNIQIELFNVRIFHQNHRHLKNPLDDIYEFYPDLLEGKIFSIGKVGELYREFARKTAQALAKDDTFWGKRLGSIGPRADSNDTKSGVDSSTSTTGGIDFRTLPIVTQAIGNLRMNMDVQAMNRLSSADVSRELEDIQRMVDAGISPSGERIKEYVQASSVQGSLDIDKVVSCISDILRLEEERCCATEAQLRDILVVLESARSRQEVKEIFVGMTNDKIQMTK